MPVSFLGSLLVPFRPLGASIAGFFLGLPPALFSASAPSCGSSWVFFLLLVDFSSFLVCHGPSFLGGFSSYRVGSLSLWLFPVIYLLRSCWVFLSVRPPHPSLLGLFQICPCILLVHLLRDSVGSQFLRDGGPRYRPSLLCRLLLTLYPITRYLNTYIALYFRTPKLPEKHTHNRWKRVSIPH